MYERDRINKGFLPENVRPFCRAKKEVAAITR